MSLNFTGQQVEQVEAVFLQAKNAEGVTVSVRVSHEVIRDKGRDWAMHVARAKYERRELNDAGGVSVYTSDAVD